MLENGLLDSIYHNMFLYELQGGDEMSTIETVIQRLGYSKSEKLFYLSDIDECSDLSWHDR